MEIIGIAVEENTEAKEKSMNKKIEWIMDWRNARKCVLPAATESTIKSSPYSEIVTSDCLYNIRVMYYIRDGSRRLIIRPDTLHKWGISKTDLEQAAWENFNNLLIHTININHLAGDYSDTNPQMIAVTNEEENGGLYLLNPSKLKFLEDILGSKFMILPSSTQDIIVVPDNILSANKAMSVIHEINEEIVIGDGLYLSDKLYKYDRGVIYDVRG